MQLTQIEQAWESFRSGNMTEAIELGQGIIQRNPGAGNGYYLLAKCYRELQDFSQAQIYYHKCIELYPDRLSLQKELSELTIDHFSVGNSLAREKKYSQAIYHYNQATKQKNCSWDVYFNLGLAYQRSGQMQEGIEAYQAAINLAPDRLDSYLNLGVLYKDAGNYGAAIDIYLRAIDIAPSAALYSNLANIYLLTDRLSEAIENCERSMEIDPSFANAYDIKGACLEQQQQTNQAINYYRLAIEKNPNLANAHFNLAHALLSLGEFKEGWQEYQWRFRRGVLLYPSFEQPLWDGSFLEGKRILLWAEQGFGDSLQFIRYVWYVRERGGKVIVRCPRSLVRLFDLVEGTEQVIAEDDPIPSFDVHASLLDLPRIFGTNLANIPRVVPYLPSPKGLVLPEILTQTDKLKIGIVWQSGEHINPSSPKLKRHKSIPFDYFLTLQNDRCLFFSLQINREQNELPETVIDLSSFIQDFADTAALIQQLDLIITIDTALAHLAAGLGKPVWVLLPFACDWRWLKDREDSPWYPTMTLFRQTDDWQTVFERIKVSLSVFQPKPLPNNEAVFQQGNNFFHHKQYDKAILAYQTAIYLGYEEVHGYFNLGVVKRTLALPEQAIIYFLLAIEQQPDYAPAYLTLAKSYIDREMLEEAHGAIQKCLQLSPGMPEGYHTLGLIYFRLGKNKEAIDYYRLAIDKNPTDALTHYNLAISLLLEGNYKEGWQEYEWRMTAQDAIINLSQPRWNGSSLQNKTILLWSEGGFGDTIQFLRYLPFLQEQGATIVLACQKQLINLMNQELKNLKIIPIEDKLSNQQFDYHLPLMSLPFILNLDHIPCPIPYISSYPKQVSLPYQKIGIVWASGYRSTPNLYRLYKQKTCPIRHFMELLSIPKIELYSFQVGKDAKDILPFLQDRVIDLSDRLQDFTDTVRLLREIDLLITVDTAIAHLAGAMGMPVWLLLPFASDWRWHQDRSDSLWYPTMTLFRQSKINDWESALEQVKDELFKRHHPFLQKADELLKEGKIAFDQGELQHAMTLFQQAVTINPNLSRGYYNLGVVCKQLKLIDEAIWAYHEALKLNEDSTLVYFSLGNLYLSIGNLVQAKEFYELSIQFNPEFIDGYISLIEITRRLKEFEVAIKYCEKLQEFNHCSAKFYNNWSLVLIDLKDYESAKQKALLAIDLDENYALAYTGLGHIAKMQNDVPSAYAYYEKSISINKSYAPTYAIYGNLLAEQGNYDRAEELYNEAINIDPDLPLAHYGKSNMLLLKGNFELGWREYEWRWQFSKIELPKFPFPQWRGEDLVNKKILIYGEQGFGDKLQFIRFTMVLQKLGATVYYICPFSLNRLFNTIPNLIILKESISFDELPPCDYFIPLMSIPTILQITIDRIPNQSPYLFPTKEEPENQFQWEGLKVGFAWASGRHSIESSYFRKSCRPEYFFDLFVYPNLRLFSLQVDEPINDLDLFKHENRLVNCSPLIKDFYDTAVIVMNLDLVITVDTALAHLAGALGKPVWVLLPFAADWRWLIDRSDSPWYPTMTLFRQSKINDWQSVIEQVKKELEKITDNS